MKKNSTSLLQKTSVTILSALTTVLQPLVVWLADNVTDVLFFLTYAEFVSDPIILNMEKSRTVNHSMLPEVQKIFIDIGAVMSLSSFAFLASVFSCTSFIPRVLFRPFAVYLMMNDPYMIDYFDQISVCDFFGNVGFGILGT